MSRKTKRFIRNGLLTLSVAVAMVVFVFASMQFVATNPWGTLALVLSGGYILAFWWANEER
jgi:hypothetical protein